MDLGVLRVSTPDGQVREYPLDVASAFIGRAEGNRVVIDHVSVSRRHARLDFINGQARLEDLASATGTYVGGQRLTPGTSHPIAPGDVVRFGDCQATLITSAGVPGAPAGGPASGGTPTTRVPGRPEQAIAISITLPPAPAAPGAAVTATVILHNRGTTVHNVAIGLQGLPSEWVRVTRPSLQLLPDARDEVTVIIHPPREPQSLAGDHEFAAVATSSQNGVEVRALGRMTLLPFGGPALELRPAQSKRDFVAEVENRSNRPAKVELRASDPGELVGVTFTPAELELTPGEQRTVRLAAKLRKAPFFGKESQHEFKVEALAHGETASANARLRHRPPWLLWRWLVFLVVLVAVAAGGWFAYNAFAGGDDNGGASPDETATPRPGTPTRAAGTPGTATPAGNRTPSPAANPTLGPGVTAIVTNSPPGNCLFIRPNPTASGGNSGVPFVCNDARLTILEGPRSAEGFNWYRVRRADGVEGWSAEGTATEKWLVPAP